MNSAYKLVPLDKDWIRAASNQNISYAKLPPGDYILQVRATNSAKEGPYATRSLSIVILPPWWQSVWAYFLYIIWEQLLADLTIVLLMLLLQ